MEQVATNGLKKSRKMPRSSIADFCNKICHKQTSTELPSRREAVIWYRQALAYALRAQCRRHDPTRRWSPRNYRYGINGGGAHGAGAPGKGKYPGAAANGGSRNERRRTTDSQ